MEHIKEIIAEVADNPEYIENQGQVAAVVDEDSLKPVLQKLKSSDIRFDQLLDITAIDYADKHEDYRYEVVYILYSIDSHTHFRLKVRLKEDKPHIISVTDIYSSADWYERETFDMYGIKFDNHPDLRRFYMPEDFTHPVTGEDLHPLRKDFPLRGIEGSLPLPPKDKPYKK